MRGKKRLSAFVMAACVVASTPFLMAPTPSCDVCLRWSGQLDATGMATQSTAVSGGIRYEAFAEVNSRGVQVNVTGPVQDLSCDESGSQGWCTFVSTGSGNVTIELDGSSNVSYTLYFGAI
jgi:hypothetical protein